MSNILKDYQSESNIDFTKNERVNVEIVNEDDPEEITENDLESEEMDLDANENDFTKKDENFATITICDLNVPFHVKNNQLFLEKRKLSELFEHGTFRTFPIIDSILAEAGIQKHDAFIFQQVKFSSHSVKITSFLCHSDHISNSKNFCQKN